MSCPQVIKIPFEKPGENYLIYQYDTIEEITGSFDETDLIDLTGATIKLIVFNGRNKILDLTSENNGGITIIDNKNFVIDEIPKEQNNLPYGVFNGYFIIIYPNTKKKTLFEVIYTITRREKDE